ncbi:unnamed protein product [Urochloa decumbens]|uniref:DCD domain-containing protein n=2 Tax=Urochloa decumbens TaxID=240449 RepID=A0ABC9DF36_9POAL
MVKKPNGVAKAAAASAGPSKANPSTPGSAKTPKFKKRRGKANREKAAAAAAAVDEAASVGAGTAGGDASASAVLPQPSQDAEASPVAQMPKSAAVAEASPVAQTPKPAADAEGSGPAPTPATAEASASAAKPKPKTKPADADADVDADAAATAAASKGKDVGADNRGGDGRTKSRRERARNGKGKEVDEDGGSKGKGKKAVGKKEERGDNKGAGFIFMCNAKTKQECYKNRLFGLPSGKIEMVKKIGPGAKLFLYDFDLKLLYGVYKAASHGGLNLVREAFDGKFPAQVKFKIDKDCLPLTENSIKQAIKENYKSRGKFDPELTARQVHRLLALFKPVSIPQSAPDNRREERRRYEERRQPHRFEERRRSLPTEEVRQARYDEERRPAAIHVPLDDPYRAPRFAPLPVESELGHSLARGDHHRYYQPALAPEPRHIPLAVEHHHVPSVPELRHVPAAYYHTLAPSSDSYYRPVENLAPERYADRTVADRTARETIIPRDYARLPGEISARSDRFEDLYQTGGIPARGARVEELYSPGEIAARADRVGITTRADRLEDLYRSDRLLTRAVDPLPRSTYHTAGYESYPAYAETSTRPVSARVSGPGVPVSSLYSFAGGPAYR